MSAHSSSVKDMLWQSHKSPQPLGKSQGNPSVNIRISCEYSLTGDDETNGYGMDGLDPYEHTKVNEE